jgi:hypothetical protein
MELVCSFKIPCILRAFHSTGSKCLPWRFWFKFPWFSSVEPCIYRLCASKYVRLFSVFILPLQCSLINLRVYTMSQIFLWINEISKAQWLLYVPPSFTLTNSMFCPRSVFMCFVWIWGKNSNYFPIEH